MNICFFDPIDIYTGMLFAIPVLSFCLGVVLLCSPQSPPERRNRYLNYYLLGCLLLSWVERCAFFAWLNHRIDSLDYQNTAIDAGMTLFALDVNFKMKQSLVCSTLFIACAFTILSIVSIGQLRGKRGQTPNQGTKTLD